MKLRFVKVNPVENMTILVLDQLPTEYHKEVANRLMNYNNIYAEQVGFIQREDPYMRLQMMGGEFCGNATRSLAAYMVYNSYPGIRRMDGGYEVELKASGVTNTIKCIVKPTDKENVYYSQIDMPLPLAVKDQSFYKKGETINTVRVDLPGIVHIIVDANLIEDKEQFFQIVKSEMDKGNYEAFGIMFYDRKKDYMEPLVYVKVTDSLYWERSCASGTCALGSALAYEENQPITRSIYQPGGSLEVTAEWKVGKIVGLELNGLVEIVAEGIVYI
ncbi:MAG: diaminopimelate epimerase [Tissierellia bacterium]|nr:diaminopimelate epimerase [Tissierellia bacterium]